ncbi:hypothetical protein CP533_0285, partial [Ophiocordyceps camponoti-saundersi (nom. inval.)]
MDGKVKTTRSEDPPPKDAADKDTADGEEEDGGGGGGADRRTADHGGSSHKPGKSPKRRRKVNHACVYCRRSERPCSRCIKRNIGHLCHDEPRDVEAKKPRSSKPAVEEAETPAPEVGRNNSLSGSSMGPPPPATFNGRPQQQQQASTDFGPVTVVGQSHALSLVQPAAGTGLQGDGIANSTSGNANSLADAWLTAQTFSDMNSYNPNYMIAPHVSHEFNLLDDFLQGGFLDMDPLAPDDNGNNAAFGRAGGPSGLLSGYGGGGRPSLPAGLGAGLTETSAADGKAPLRVAASATDKTREYYLQAADPSGNDNAEERMARVLRAKYEAGLLKPFNYINGYARLGKYLDGHIAPSSKQKILRTINQFRPKFREKAQGLTDMQLVYVEMWFERQLMDYDRVFASMAVPACCWRRTGEIFRGNKEMAELIAVPVDELRDGKIALHEILTEESMVRYWEEFGTIAFDPAHETLLTACSLKNPSDSSDHPIVKCCFSFSIRRDEHKLTARSIIGTKTPVPRFFAHSLIVSREDFATELEAKLPTIRDVGAVEVLTADLGQRLQAIQSLQLRIGGGGSHAVAGRDLERRGRSLWNVCIRTKRDVVLEEPFAKLLLSARVLAFHMLEMGRMTASRSRKGQDGEEGERENEERDVVYLLSLALTLARICVVDSELAQAKLALRKAAEYVDRLRRRPAADVLVGPAARLEVEYLTMRMTLAWREDRLDVAEHMYGKTDALRRNLDAPAVETMADALRHIGADLSSKGNHTLALQWLRRAHELIDALSPEHLSTLGLELRLAICHGRVRSLLAICSPDSLQEAEDLVAYVESELGDKPVVLHWRLEILKKSPKDVMGVEAYASILRRMVRCFDRSDDTLQFLLHQFTELGRDSERLASGLLDELMRQHVFRSANPAWIGKVMVKRIEMATTAPHSDALLASLRSLMDEANDALSGPLKPDAAGAAHSLVWQRVEALFVVQEFVTADAWCELGLHDLFTSAGEANAGKFGRKRILCALKVNDAERAKEAFHKMPEGPQLDALSCYLMFKVSLLCWDHELGCQSIEQLGKASGTARGRDMLYACVREAQQFGDRLCAVAALRAVADSWAVGPVSPEGLPAVLRCMIRLMHMTGEEEEEASASGEGVELDNDFAAETCDVFEKGCGF